MVARNLEPLKHKINIILTVLSTVFLSVATVRNWWTQGYGDSAVHFSIWKMVICDSGVCLVSTVNTSGKEPGNDSSISHKTPFVSMCLLNCKKFVFLILSF
jgi:hypothetical protein